MIASGIMSHGAVNIGVEHMNKNILGILILTLVSVVWGFAFVVQSSSVEMIPTFTLNFLRSMFAVFALLLYKLVSNKLTKKKITANKDKKTLIKAGVISGIFLSIATNVQQFGIAHTTAGKAGFITALYIIFVPIIGLFLKKKVELNVWISVILALVGFYLMTMFNSDASLTLGVGEGLILLCALFFAFQIITVDKYVEFVDGVYLSIIQFATVAVFSFIPMVIEKPTFDNIIIALPNILYLGVVSSGVGYTLQIIGQKYVRPTVASLVMSLESVFSLIFGIIVLHESPQAHELIGCVLIFAGVILTQVKFKNKGEELC